MGGRGGVWEKTWKEGLASLPIFSSHTERLNLERTLASPVFVAKAGIGHTWNKIDL